MTLESPEVVETDVRYTPPEVTRVMLDRLDLPPMTIAEPCAGDGWIARELRARGHEVVTGDVDQDAPVHWPGLDLFSQGAGRIYSDVDAVVTNPPWSYAPMVVRHCLEVWGVPRVVMLLRLTFLEACNSDRYPESKRDDLMKYIRRLIVLPRVRFIKGAPGTDNCVPMWVEFAAQGAAPSMEWVSPVELERAAGQGVLFAEEVQF